MIKINEVKLNKEIKKLKSFQYSNMLTIVEKKELEDKVYFLELMIEKYTIK